MPTWREQVPAARRTESIQVKNQGSSFSPYWGQGCAIDLVVPAASRSRYRGLGDSSEGTGPAATGATDKETGAALVPVGAAKRQSFRMASGLRGRPVDIKAGLAGVSYQRFHATAAIPFKARASIQARRKPIETGRSQKLTSLSRVAASSPYISTLAKVYAHEPQLK